MGEPYAALAEDASEARWNSPSYRSIIISAIWIETAKQPISYWIEVVVIFLSIQWVMLFEVSMMH